jgi:hypothetical protein
MLSQKTVYMEPEFQAQKAILEYEKRGYEVIFPQNTTTWNSILLSKFRDT